jgi:glyoxylase-like metal-dependent hydrolase (beta-lactamase superfamily II)
MEIVALGPRLHLIRPVFGQAYLWRDDDGVTLVDSGIPGSESAFAAAFDELGLRRTDLRRIVITHGHEDHMGSAAALRAWGDVTVFAHRADAPILRGWRRRAEPTLTPAERPIYAEVSATMPAVSPCPVDVELVDGDTVDFGGGARVIATPGHTDGSIAVSLPDHGVLFTGDLVANGAPGSCSGRSTPTAAWPDSRSPHSPRSRPRPSASATATRSRVRRGRRPGAGSANAARRARARCPTRWAEDPQGVPRIRSHRVENDDSPCRK